MCYLFQKYYAIGLERFFIYFYLFVLQIIYLSEEILGRPWRDSNLESIRGQARVDAFFHWETGPSFKANLA